MAVNIQTILEKLDHFYDFTDKTVISVGAGGGQLVDFARSARRVLAVDNDAQAIARLKTVLAEKGIAEYFEPVLCDFFDFGQKADVLIFEFSFHEMSEPALALAHARSLAPDVLIFDHWPESPWAWQVVEEDKVARSAAVYREVGLEEESVYWADQRFSSYEELMLKVQSQGPTALLRAEGYRGHRDFIIPMRYGLARLR